MKRHPIAAAVCLAALGLAACSDADDDMRANSGLCPDWKAAKPAAGDAAAPVDECVKRWAYSLASSRDDAGVVADAAAAACSGALSRWNQQSLAQPEAGDGEALSITTGQPTNPMAEHNAFANGRALLYVVQARAGRCDAPPIKDGVPEGLPG